MIFRMPLECLELITPSLVAGCVAHGKAGHAARKEGENALYNALDVEGLEPVLLVLAREGVKRLCKSSKQ